MPCSNKEKKKVAGYFFLGMAAACGVRKLTPLLFIGTRVSGRASRSGPFSANCLVQTKRRKKLLGTFSWHGGLWGEKLTPLPFFIGTRTSGPASWRSGPFSANCLVQTKRRRKLLVTFFLAWRRLVGLEN
uniref:hypothetical protein n=1 Tax=Bacillus cytotoxicus TaxID=580165 RepID=UPI00203C5196